MTQIAWERLPLAYRQGWEYRESGGRDVLFCNPYARYSPEWGDWVDGWCDRDELMVHCA